MKQQSEQHIHMQIVEKGFKEQMKKMLSLFLFALLFLPINTISTLAASNKTEIKILATSDMHNTFYPYDYAADSDYSRGGFTRVASAIEAARTENTILVDNGDTLQGIASILNMSDDVNPMIIGMNALNYDVWNSGNHEFNYGVPFLEKVVATFNGQFLLSNVYDQQNQRLRGAKNYTIIERNGIKIAVIGVLTPNITRWDRANLENYRVTDPKTEVAQAVEEIQAGNLADLTVVTFHASVGGEYEGLTDSAEKIVRDVPHIDAMIAGHEHAVIGKIVQGKTNPVPIVEPGRFGDYVSEITLNVSFENGKYRVVDYDNDVTYRNIKTADYPNDSVMMNVLTPFHERALADARTVIGELRDGPLVPKAKINGITQAQIEDTPLLDLILKVQLQTVEDKGIIPKGARHVSGAALFTEQANIQQGNITKADAASIYKFDNTLMTIKTTGLGLKRYMEWSASYYNHFEEGDLTISFNPEVRIYNYDMFAGVRYAVNIGKPVGARIDGLQYLDGKSVLDTDEVYISVNNYRANTHLLGWLLPAGAEIVYDSVNEETSTVRDKIVEYIKEVKTLYPEVDHNWRATGYQWNDDLHEVVSALVNRGDLTVPKSSDGRTPNVRPIRREDIISAANVIDLLSINDFHGAVEEAGKNIGGAKMGGVVKTKKAENPNTLLLGAGDLFQGSAISNLTKGEVVSDLLEEFGMVYSAVGNHEFDWGIDILPQMAQNGNFQFLAANIVLKNGATSAGRDPIMPTWAKPYGILHVGGKKIGLIGLTTPATAYQTAPTNVQDLLFLDPVPTAAKWERYLRDTEGVDLVFALTHMASEYQGDAIVGEAADLARRVPTLDGIFSSHSHRFVEGKVGDVPIVQGGFNGRGISNMSIIYTKDGEKLAIVPIVEDLSREVASLAEDPASRNIIIAYRAKLAPILNEVIGTNYQDLSHERLAGHNLTAMGQATAKMMSEVSGVDIAVVNGGGIRAGLHQGDITIGDMYTLFPFDNTLATADVTGAHLKQIIQHGINPPDFRPGQFYGLTVWYELDASGAPQITSMRMLNGEKVEDNKVYRVATIDFLIAGGDRYDFVGATNIMDTAEPLREKLSEQIKANGGIRHNFVQALVLGSDASQEGNITNPDDKLIKTGTHEREALGAAVLLFGISSWYLRRRYVH